MRNTSRRCENYFWHLFHIFVSIACNIYWCQTCTPPAPNNTGGRELQLQISMDWHDWQAWLNWAQWQWKYLLCVCDILIQPGQLHILYNYSWSPVISLTEGPQHQQLKLKLTANLPASLMHSMVQLYKYIIISLTINYKFISKHTSSSYTTQQHHTKKPLQPCSYLEPGNCCVVWMK